MFITSENIIKILPIVRFELYHKESSSLKRLISQCTITYCPSLAQKRNTIVSLHQIQNRKPHSSMENDECISFTKKPINGHPLSNCKYRVRNWCCQSTLYKDSEQKKGICACCYAQGCIPKPCNNCFRPSFIPDCPCPRPDVDEDDPSF